MPVLCICTVLAAIAIHETGHAVAGYLTGGHVEEVVLLSVRPHVSMNGPFTREATAWTAAAGSSSIFLAWALWVLIAGSGPAWRASVRAFSLMAFVEACGWFLSSLLFPLGPRSEDGWTFLEQSAIHPGWSAVIAFVVGAFALRLFLAGEPANPEFLSASAPHA